VNVEIVSEKTMQRISSLKTPQGILALVKIPKSEFFVEAHNTGLVLVLDTIKDPGNLGTIIRIADWFGITDIVCSESSVDCYNPKVVQASMGSVFRVNMHYLELGDMLFKAQQLKIPIYGSTLHGTNLYTEDLKPAGILVMGNESEGISAHLLKFIDHKITIPHGNLNESSTESLNVAVATGIICAEFFRTNR
jgi:TrmH family RNA methyltransferase